MSIDFRYELVEDIIPIKLIHAKEGDWEPISHKWKVFLNDQEFPFSMGLGHRRATDYALDEEVKSLINKFSHRKKRSLSDARRLVEISTPVPPSLDDVLWNLLLDSDLSDQSFEEWCKETGHDEDSRKAYKTWEFCRENGRKLEATGIDLDAERERLQDC